LKPPVPTQPPPTTRIREKVNHRVLLHGDEGKASAWAYKAAIGDELVIGFKTGKLLPCADWYLFAGDETAPPAAPQQCWNHRSKQHRISPFEVGSAVDTLRSTFLRL